MNEFWASTLAEILAGIIVAVITSASTAFGVWLVKSYRRLRSIDETLAQVVELVLANSARIDSTEERLDGHDDRLDGHERDITTIKGKLGVHHDEPQKPPHEAKRANQPRRL